METSHLSATHWFAAADAAAQLGAMTDAHLDALPFGVVEMNPDCVVLRYNATESGFSGLPPARVIGRHFFRDVAPCADNALVAQRYQQPSLDEIVQFTFSFRIKAVPVTLRLLKPAGQERMYLLVIAS